MSNYVSEREEEDVAEEEELESIEDQLTPIVENILRKKKEEMKVVPNLKPALVLKGSDVGASRYDDCALVRGVINATVNGFTVALDNPLLRAYNVFDNFTTHVVKEGGYLSLHGVLMEREYTTNTTQITAGLTLANAKLADLYKGSMFANCSPSECLDNFYNEITCYLDRSRVVATQHNIHYFIAPQTAGSLAPTVVEPLNLVQFEDCQEPSPFSITNDPRYVRKVSIGSGPTAVEYYLGNFIFDSNTNTASGYNGRVGLEYFTVIGGYNALSTKAVGLFFPRILRRPWRDTIESHNQESMRTPECPFIVCDIDERNQWKIDTITTSGLADRIMWIVVMALDMADAPIFTEYIDKLIADQDDECLGLTGNDYVACKINKRKRMKGGESNDDSVVDEIPLMGGNHMRLSVSSSVIYPRLFLVGVRHGGAIVKGDSAKNGAESGLNDVAFVDSKPLIFPIRHYWCTTAQRLKSLGMLVEEVKIGNITADKTRITNVEQKVAFGMRKGDYERYGDMDRIALRAEDDYFIIPTPCPMPEIKAQT